MAKQMVSFRFYGRTVKRLEQLVRAHNTDKTAIVETLIRNADKLNVTYPAPRTAKRTTKQTATARN